MCFNIDFCPAKVSKSGLDFNTSAPTLKNGAWWGMSFGRKIFFLILEKIIFKKVRRPKNKIGFLQNLAIIKK